MRFVLVLALALAAAACAARSTSTTAPTAAPSAAPTDGYDAALAERLGADERGMRSYVVAFLVPGPNRGQPPEEAKALMTAHLANIVRMADEGTLVLAGPFRDEGPYAGIYVFAVETVEEAAALTATDPAIQAGRLAMELHPWYGSAALGELNALHRRIQRTPLVDAKK